MAKFCSNCGAELTENQDVCLNCGKVVSEKKGTIAASNGKEKLVFGLLAILLGSLGVQHFYVGNSKRGVTYLLVSLLTLGIGAIVISIISLIEGIIALCGTEEEFQNKYCNF